MCIFVAFDYAETAVTRHNSQPINLDTDDSDFVCNKTSDQAIPGSLRYATVMNCRGILLALAILSVIGWTSPATAATLCLRPEYVSHGGSVTLGDLCEIEQCDENTQQALAAIPLFPPPALGETRFVRREELRDLLILRGIDIAMHEWSGTSCVRIITSPETPQHVIQDQATNAAAAKQLRARAEGRLREALERYFKMTYPALPNYRFSFDVDPQDLRWLAAAGAEAVVQADLPIARDRRQVTARIQTPSGVRTTRIVVQLAEKPSVVVAARPLSRDSILLPEDLVTNNDADAVDTDVVTTLQEAVGRQVTVSVPVGRPIPKSALRDPLVVRRGEVVQIVVKAPGVVVRTLGRAKDDGLLGHLVPIETIDERGKTIMGRAVGRQEVELYAASLQAR